MYGASFPFLLPKTYSTVSVTRSAFVTSAYGSSLYRLIKLQIIRSLMISRFLPQQQEYVLLLHLLVLKLHQNLSCAKSPFTFYIPKCVCI